MRAYSVGVSLGAGLAFVIGGMAAGVAAQGEVVLPLVGGVHGWQAAFIIVGLPGVLIGLLLLTVREPARRNRVSGAAAVPLSAVWRFVLERKQLAWAYVVGVSLLTALSLGSLAWGPSFFIRVHGMTAQQTGAAVGVMILVLATLGIFGGGWVASRMARQGHKDATFRTAAWAAGLSLRVCSALGLAWRCVLRAQPPSSATRRRRRRALRLAARRRTSTPSGWRTRAARLRWRRARRS
jgi:MFS family permease